MPRAESNEEFFWAPDGITQAMFRISSAGVYVWDPVAGAFFLLVPVEGGGVYRGTATVDFGVATGSESNLASVTLAGLTWVAAGSNIQAYVKGASTADHDPEDSLVEQIACQVSDLVVGVGFTINAFSPHGTWGTYTVAYCGG